MAEEETAVMVRYGELFLKSEPVKKRFISILIGNIGKTLQANELSFQIESPRGRIIIHGDRPREIALAVARVFGVVDTGICIQTGSDPEDIAKTAVAIAKKSLSPGMSFAVRAKREKKEGMPSPQLAAYLGEEISRHIPGLRVDLNCPQYELHAEVRTIGGLVCDQRFSGPGGLPLGTQGRVLTLLSSGIDSPVAAWMMMRRGCLPRCIFFDAEEWSGTGVRRGAEINLQRLSTWCPGDPLEMELVPVGRLFRQMEAKDIPPRFRCVICKRFMYATASLLAAEIGAEALVTGENLGQVASQTLTNLVTISGAATLPVLRPLIAYDKKEIIDCGRRIGTFPGPGGDLSCRAVPHKPSTGALQEEIWELEKRLNIPHLVRECIQDRHSLTARDGRILPS